MYSLIYREDAGFPMNYFLDDLSYEMSFMEGVLSSKASEAKEAGLGLYCLLANLKKPLTKEMETGLASMAKHMVARVIETATLY